MRFKIGDKASTTKTIVKNLTKGTPLEIAGETKVGVNTY